MPDRFDIVVLGATGFTGSLIASELRRQGVRFAVAGRRPGALEKLVDAPTAVIQADVRAQESLERIARKATVIINTVGPFDRYGDAVVDAALSDGAHYIDTTAEQAWIRRLHTRLRTFARDAGLAFVPAQAVDFAPALTSAHLLARDFGTLHSLHVTHWLDAYRTSRGTAISAIHAAGAPAYGWRRRQPVLLDDLLSWTAHRHPDIPRQYREVLFPGAEPILLPGELPGLRDIDSCLALPAPRAHGFAAFQKLFSGSRQPTPRRLAQIERFVAARSRNPDERQRAQATWHVVARGASADGSTAAIRMEGVDIYQTTARLAACAAASLAGAHRVRGGVGSLAAALGVDTALQCCADSGAHIEHLP